jgi:Ran GTPase-activating protein (RanGAP) involved in mRNA processing and transport
VLLSRGGGKGDCRDDENGVSNNSSDRLDTILDRVRHNDPRLTNLDLQNMDIGLKDIGRIVDAMSKNSHLQNVNLSRNMIDDDCVSTLSLALAENTLSSITQLSLANNCITSIGAEYLLCSLENNATILDVDLSGNSIDHEVLAELDYALKQRRA